MDVIKPKLGFIIKTIVQSFGIFFIDFQTSAKSGNNKKIQSYFHVALAKNTKHSLKTIGTN